VSKRSALGWRVRDAIEFNATDIVTTGEADWRTAATTSGLAGLLKSCCASPASKGSRREWSCNWVLATLSRSLSCEVFIQPYRAKFRRAWRSLPQEVPNLLKASWNQFRRNLFGSGESSLGQLRLVGRTTAKRLVNCDDCPDGGRLTPFAFWSGASSAIKRITAGVKARR
jgi:hypothetical protein